MELDGCRGCANSQRSLAIVTFDRRNRHRESPHVERRPLPSHRAPCAGARMRLLAPPGETGRCQSSRGDPGVAPHAGLVTWPRLRILRVAEGKQVRALVVGCGLGDDAEELARLGMQVVAFDVASAAVESARRRFPASTVRYEVADLLAPPR